MSSHVSDPLVTPEWLAAHLQSPHLAVLDATLPPVGVTPAVDTHARYLAQHIPGAAFFDIEALSDKRTSLPHMLPDPDTFAESMSALGLTESMTFVVYEQDAVFSAPRARWMLRTLGARNVCLLDGGLQAWLRAGYPVEAGPVKRKRACFTATLDAGATRSFAQMQANLAGAHNGTPSTQILDARSGGRFRGTAPEPRAGLASGHMPGAISVPYTDLVENGRLLPPEQLRSVFTRRQVDLAKPITTTCGSGITAAVVALALERCGAPQVSLYDGSWAEYASRPGAVILQGR